jgi:hypothetical protein
MTAPAVVDDGLDVVLAQAHADVREELGRANTTALGIAGAVATLAAVGLAALMAGQWSPARLPVADRVVWWAGVVAAAAGMALLGAVAMPRIAPDTPGLPPTSWGPIAAYTDMPTLTAALRTLAADPAPRIAHLHCPVRDRPPQVAVHPPCADRPRRQRRPAHRNRPHHGGYMTPPRHNHRGPALPTECRATAMSRQKNGDTPADIHGALT